jgi:hypothetical protein
MYVWLRWTSRIRELPTGAGALWTHHPPTDPFRGSLFKLLRHHPVHSGESNPWRRVQLFVCRNRVFSSATAHWLVELILCLHRDLSWSRSTSDGSNSSPFLYSQTATESHRSALQSKRARPFAYDQRELRRAFLFLQAYHSRVSHHVAANTSLLWRELMRGTSLTTHVIPPQQALKLARDRT